ncbi:MAG: PLD nuclease N-terminal domain-containing protein [Bacteroidota bacterium]
MTSFRTLPVLALGALALVLTGCGGANFGDMVFGGAGGVCGLLHIIAVVWAFVNIANSTADTGSKLLWGAFVFFFPLLGLAVWYFAGPRSA